MRLLVNQNWLAVESLEFRALLLLFLLEVKKSPSYKVVYIALKLLVNAVTSSIVPTWRVKD
jgi:hypothetical protein